VRPVAKKKLTKKSISKKAKEALPAHSSLGASSCERWCKTGCPASVRLSEGLSSPPSTRAALIGTAAHSLAEKCLTDTPNTNFYVGKEFDGIMVDQDMADNVQGYVDEVRRKYYRILRDGDVDEVMLYVEERLSIEHLVKGGFGTTDTIIAEELGDLVVWDYKNGRVPVYAKENKQLMFYGVAAMELGTFFEVNLGIYQPNAGKRNALETWTTTPERLEEFGEFLIESAAETKNPKAAIREGGYCFFCPVLYHSKCPVHIEKSNSLVKKDFASIDAIDGMTMVQKVKLLKSKKNIMAFIEHVEERVLQDLKDGKKVKGLKLVRGRGARRWGNDKLAAKFLKKKIGDDAYSNPKLITPAQAEKKFNSGKSFDKLQKLIFYVEGKPQIADAKDGREKIADAESDFAGVVIDTKSERVKKKKDMSEFF